jgi:branched-chain amino acid transport system substrate-binding protein
VLLLSAVALATAFAGASSSASSGGTINIGVVGGQSGLYAYVGDQQAAGVKLAAQQINAAGGVGGRKINVIYVDDAADPSRAISALVKFSSQDHVSAIIGSPDTAAAVAPYAQRIKTPLVGAIDGGGQNIYPNGPGTTPLAWDFAITQDVYSQAIAFASYAKPRCQKIAMLHDTTTYGVPAAAATVTDLKSEPGSGKIVLDDPVAENWTSASTPSVAPEVQRVKSTGANCLITWISPQATAAFVKSAASGGYKPRVIGSDQLNTFPQYGPLAGAAANGTISLELKTMAHPTAEYKAVLKAFTKANPNTVMGGYVVFSYAALQVIVDAIKKAGSSAPASVRTALESISNFPSVAGPITFNTKAHEAITPNHLSYVRFSSATNTWVPIS